MAGPSVISSLKSLAGRVDVLLNWFKDYFVVSILIA